MRHILPKQAYLVPPHAKRVFKGIIYDVYHWDQQLYDGTIKTFEMLKRPDTVKVIAVDQNKIVILEQEQPHVGFFYDIPGGMHDHEEEDELTAIRRELFEETGMQFSNWKLLIVVQPHRKIDQFVYTFLATDLASQVAQSLDGGEKINVKLVDFDVAKELLGSSKGRHLAKELEKASSLKELLSLSEYT